MSSIEEAAKTVLEAEERYRTAPPGYELVVALGARESARLDNALALAEWVEKALAVLRDGLWIPSSHGTMMCSGCHWRQGTGHDSGCMRAQLLALDTPSSLAAEGTTE